MRHVLLPAALLCLIALPASAVQPDAPLTIERAWYTPHELLPLVATQTGGRWAMPQTLAGNALVGGKATPLKSLLDEACRQWGLSWTLANNVLVVHRPVEGLEALSPWQLGWSRDGRAVPLLAEVLAGPDVAKALAAAQALEVLEKRVPLGRTDRVVPILPGRVSLATAFPPKADLAGLLDSPHPPIRAAALRLMLGMGGQAAAAAEKATADDRADLVRQVRQQMLFPAPQVKEGEKPAPRGEQFPPVPDEAKAECEKMLARVPALAGQSEWEQMRQIARTIADWARRGSDEAVEALLELSRTKVQGGWYPGYVHMQMARVGDKRVVARLAEIFAAPNANHDTLVRGLEEVMWGEQLLAMTRPHMDSQTVLYVTANKAGCEAVAEIAKRAEGTTPGCFAAIDALGVIGGPQAVEVLTRRLDDPSSTVTFRSAKALAKTASLDALAALQKAADSEDRFRRHAGTLYVGRIGGSKAIATLELRVKDADRLVAAAAADGLDQIGTDPAKASADAFRKKDAGLPPLVYQPRNPKFGPDFPVNKWVRLDVQIEAYANYGEMGWNYDAANRLFVRYGGCSGYTNELTIFDLGTEKFVQRRPNEEMAGWDSRRPQRGCSGGREYDPYRKVVWIGQSIGGSAADLAISEYYVHNGGYSFSSYDMATDTFRSAPYLENYYGGPPMRYAYDWKNGLFYPVKFSPFKNEKPFWVVQTRDADPWTPEAWIDKTTKGDYPRMLHYTVAAVDQHSGLLVLYIPPGKRQDEPDRAGPETWTFNPTTGQWKNMKPAVQPAGVSGAGLDYDPFHKVLILQSGVKVGQYGGPKDSITWSYDVRTNTWTDMKAEGGPGNPWVGAQGFDPEHNVLVLFNFRDHHVWVYRPGAVAVGTQVNWDAE